MTSIVILGVKLETFDWIRLDDGPIRFEVLEIAPTLVKLARHRSGRGVLYLERRSAKCAACPWYRSDTGGVLSKVEISR